MDRPPVDRWNSPEGIVILPHISATDQRIFGAAYRLAMTMHPLNAEAVYAEVEELLLGLSGDNTQRHEMAARRNAQDQRDAMLGMGADRVEQGLHPVPDHLRHLL